MAGRGRAFSACCFAGKLRSLVIPGLAALGPGGFDPHVIPYVIPYALGVRTPGSLAERISAGQVPFVGPVSRKNRG